MQPAATIELETCLQKLAAFSARRRNWSPCAPPRRTASAAPPPCWPAATAPACAPSTQELASIDSALAAPWPPAPACAPSSRSSPRSKASASPAPSPCSPPFLNWAPAPKPTIASLAGLAPFNRDRGLFRAPPHPRRPPPRSLRPLHARTRGLRHNPFIQSFYSHLRFNGKPPQTLSSFFLI